MAAAVAAAGELPVGIRRMIESMPEAADNTPESIIDKIAKQAITPMLYPPEIPNAGPINEIFETYVSMLAVLLRGSDAVHDFSKPRPGISDELARHLKVYIIGLIRRIFTRINTISDERGDMRYTNLVQLFDRFAPKSSFEPLLSDYITTLISKGNTVYLNSDVETLRLQSSEKMLINRAPNSVEDADDMERRIKIFLGYNPDAPLFVMNDASPSNIVANIFRLKNANGAINLITPSTVADSADTYGSSSSFPGEVRYERSPIGGAVLSEFFSKPFLKLSYRPQRNFSNLNPTAFDMVIQSKKYELSGEEFIINHDGFTSGPPVAHIMNSLQTDIPEPPSKQYALPLMSMIYNNTEKSTRFDLLADDGRLSTLAYLIGFDVKTRGDYGQAGDAFVFHKMMLNVIFVTGDWLAATIAILLGVPTIIDAGTPNNPNIIVFKGKQRGEITEEMIRANLLREYQTKREKIFNIMSYYVQPGSEMHRRLLATDSHAVVLGPDIFTPYFNLLKAERDSIITILDNISNDMRNVDTGSLGLSSHLKRICDFSIDNILTAIPRLIEKYRSKTTISESISTELTAIIPIIKRSDREIGETDVDRLQTYVNTLTNAYSIIINDDERLRTEFNKLGSLTKRLQTIESRKRQIDAVTRTDIIKSQNYVFDLRTENTENAYLCINDILNVQKGFNIVDTEYTILTNKIRRIEESGRPIRGGKNPRETHNDMFIKTITKMLLKPYDSSIKYLNNASKEELDVDRIRELISNISLDNYTDTKDELLTSEFIVDPAVPAVPAAAVPDIPDIPTIPTTPDIVGKIVPGMEPPHVYNLFYLNSKFSLSPYQVCSEAVSILFNFSKTIAETTNSFISSIIKTGGQRNRIFYRKLFTKKQKTNTKRNTKRNKHIQYGSGKTLYKGQPNTSIKVTFKKIPKSDKQIKNINIFFNNVFDALTNYRLDCHNLLINTKDSYPECIIIVLYMYSVYNGLYERIFSHEHFVETVLRYTCLYDILSGTDYSYIYGGKVSKSPETGFPNLSLLYNPTIILQTIEHYLMPFINMYLSGVRYKSIYNLLEKSVKTHVISPTDLTEKVNDIKSIIRKTRKEKNSPSTSHRRTLKFKRGTVPPMRMRMIRN